jgi:magnesium transporter
MIILYQIVDNNVKRVKYKTSEGQFPDDVVWIDLMNPSSIEKSFLQSELGVNIQSRNALDKTEVSNPFYNEGGAYYMTVTTLCRNEEGYLDGTPLTFILKNKFIISLRYTQPTFFPICEASLMKRPDLCIQPEVILGEIINSAVNSLAEILEVTGNKLDRLLNHVFENPYGSKTVRHSADYYGDTIKNIGRIGNVISKNRESIMSFNRLLIFYNQIETPNLLASREHRQRFHHLASEVHSLSSYATFISQRHMFLLDATLGLLDVEQNKIIKVFTVAAAAFMPPTMIASIYGMNFDNMPELHWKYSYPIALAVIILSAIFPYIYFKMKKWL